MVAIKRHVAQLGGAVHAETHTAVDIVQDAVVEAAGAVGWGPGLGFREDGRGRVARGRHRDAHKAPAGAEVPRHVAEHGDQPRAIGRVVQQPGAKHEVKGPPRVHGWLRAIGEDEIHASAGRPSRAQQEKVRRTGTRAFDAVSSTEGAFFGGPPQPSPAKYPLQPRRSRPISKSRRCSILTRTRARGHGRSG